MRVSKNFILNELVDRDTYTNFGSNAAWFLDPRAVEVLQFLRDRFGSTTVNNWANGGNLSFRGFRPPTTSVGGKLSQHRFGRAFDCNFTGATPDEVREDIIKNQSMYLDKGLTTIEDGAYSPTWLHFDIRWTGQQKIKIVKP